MVEDGSFVYVKPAERDRPEEGGPDARSDLLEADVLAAEQVGDVDPDGVPPNPAVCGDLSNLEVRGVLRRSELRGHGSWRACVGRGGRPLAEGFVGPDLVEVGPELVEPTLLGRAVTGWRDGGLGLEGPVHALVTAVLLR